MAQPEVVQTTHGGGQGFMNGFAQGGMEFTPSDSSVQVEERGIKNVGGIFAIAQNSVNESIEPVEYKSYPERWWLVASVALLNVANDAHWISFASVNSKAAVFYQCSADDISRIVTISYGIGMPFCIVGTYVVSKYGLRPAISIGALLTFSGSLLCCLSTFPYLRDLMTPATWYWMSLIGQALTGMGIPFIACVPTKISNHWFQEHQRIIATTILSLSNPVGIVLGQAVTPLFVVDSSKVPIMNIVWFVPALVGSALVLLTVKSSYPPSPPSRSAQLNGHNSPEISYLKSIWILLRNLPFMILTLTIGGTMSCISALETVAEEVMCSLGYANYFSGLCAALIFIGGLVGSFLFSFAARKAGKRILYVVKFSTLMTGLIIISLIFVIRLSHQEALYAVTFTALGFFAIGSYPVLLELAVEATYPVDEAIVTAMITISSAIQGVVIMEMDAILKRPAEEKFVESTCHGDTEPEDHMYYIYFLNGYGAALSLGFLFFRPTFKRAAVNQIEDVHQTTII